MDIWAYIVSRNLDYNLAYDVMEKLKVPLERQRIAEFQIDKVLGFGTLVLIKQGWSEFFNRYANEHPEARSYV